jgi:hypothetical protein
MPTSISDFFMYNQYRCIEHSNGVKDEPEESKSNEKAAFKSNKGCIKEL